MTAQAGPRSPGDRNNSTGQRAMAGQGGTTCRVTLGADERTRLWEIVDGGRGSKERRRRVPILLRADRDRPGGGRRDAAIADVLGVGTATVERVRTPCVRDGLEAALERTVPVNRTPRRRDGAGAATLTMRACSQPPAGPAHRASTHWGPCRGGPTRGWPARSWAPSPARPSPRRSRNQSHARAEPMRVHSPQVECRSCACHGGWAHHRPA